MNDERRLLLRRASAGAALAVLAAAGLLRPERVLAAWNENAFRAKSSEDALKSLGIERAEPSREVVIEAPQIAENGAVVPIEITSRVPGTRSIDVLIDNNPFPLASRFEFTDEAVPYVKVNVKMAKTSQVRAIAQAGGNSYVATREIKVTIGGCGG